MGAKRAHIVFPAEILAQVDAKAGPRGRSALVTDILRREFNREHILEFLNSKEPAWKDEDHPELAEGSYKWVRSLRDENNKRFEKIMARRRKK
ncbi:MAG: hypothetical protein ABR910_16555 [Acidobacteriaceae bacterium]|jgi:hypothetical protein